MRIDDSVISEIKALEPAALEGKSIISAAPKKSNGEQTYICPKCGSGSGKKGTGIVVYRDGGDVSFYCFACDTRFSNIDLIAHHYGLDPKSDFVEVCKHACDDFGIAANFDYTPDSARDFERAMARSGFDAIPAPVHREPPKNEPPNPDEIDMIRADIAKAQANLDNLPENARRGLDIETLRQFGCGFIGDWTSPKSRLGNYFETKTPRLIIPSGEHYLARLIVPVETFGESQREYIKAKAHAGVKAPFNVADIDKVIAGNWLCVTEGEIDAMSVYEMTLQRVVATGGTSGWHRLLDILKEKNFDAEHTRSVLILFDGDKAGRDAAENFRQALIEAGIPAAARFIHDFLPDEDTKIDFNDLCRRDDGIKTALAFMNSIRDGIRAEFDAARKQITDRQQKVFDEAAAADKSYNDDPDILKLLYSMPFNDVYNGRRLALVYNRRIRFLQKPAERWGVYTKGVWDVNCKSNAVLFPLATGMIDILKTHKPTDVDVAKSAALDECISKWGKKSTVCNAIEMLKGVDRVIITQEDLNTHPNLLNVANGVVDLETGKHYPHDPKLLLTQKIPVPYIQGASNDTLSKFWRDILPDENTRNAVIRWFGYCITGEIREEKALFIWGPGGNGKGTLTLIITTLMGDYACSLPTKALLYNPFDNDGDKATPALATLLWSRVAITEEIPPGGVLDSSKFKLLSGGDPIPYRKLHEDFSVIKKPTHKLILSGNYLPELKDANDPGLQRRLVRVNFTQNFRDNADIHLKDKLLAQDAQIALLAMLVDAARNYYRDGLIISDEMNRAKSEYFIEQDFIREFIYENCEFDENESIPRPALVREIKGKCDSARNMSNIAICAALDKINGLTKIHKRTGYVIKGIKWKSTD